MESVLYHLMTILFIFTTVNGAAIKSNMTDINDIMPENCKKLLLEKKRTGQRTYCTEKPEFFPKELQDEIEARLGEVSLFKTDRKPTELLRNDDCTSEDAKQNCCTQSGWETPTFETIVVNNNKQNAYVVQSQSFIQEIKIVKCAIEGKKCFDNLSFLSTLGYYSKCKTNYANQKLFFYTENKEFVWAPVPTPVSCSCVIVNQSDVPFPEPNQMIDEYEESDDYYG